VSLDHSAVIKAYPSAVFTNDISGAFDQNGKSLYLDSALIAKARFELDTAAAAIKYRSDRKLEYPEIGDQLDDLFKKGAFSDEMSAKIKAVKDKYPKP
jgi:hypothetical protein